MRFAAVKLAGPFWVHRRARITGGLARALDIGRWGTGSTALDGLICGILLAALATMVAVTQIAPYSTAHAARGQQLSDLHVIPPEAVPSVDPLAFKVMTPAEARAFNASVPLSTEPNPPARPFVFSGSEEDRLRALDCLAAAVLYEAGDDPTGQRAVAQVVLNRVRHPAFPRTVCGVVFQGSERRTGCQFTFTCDGALTRSYAEPLWDRARRIADAALSGAVYKTVGMATHYHTDWVVPYWSSSLDKIVAVDTHLFFRWTGWWGTPPAFRFRATGFEPRILQLAARFPEHGLADDAALAASLEAGMGLMPAAITDRVLAPIPGNPDAFLVLLSPADASSFAELAAFTCGARSNCKFMGWTDPAKLPRDLSAKLTAEQLAAVSFSYLRNRSINLERALWNCAEFKRPAEQCLWSKSAAPEAKPVPAATPSPTAAALDGVRFKNEPLPGTKP
jgi:spore germination cell wall hydrolase CwlJ-like protein